MSPQSAVVKRGKTRGKNLPQVIRDFCTFTVRPLHPCSFSFGEAASPTLLPASEALTSSTAPQTHPEVTNTFPERLRCLEGRPKPSRPPAPTGNWRNRSQFLCAFPIPLLSTRAPPSKTRNELAQWRSVLPGNQPSINNQLHANLPELQVRQAYLHGTPRPSLHTDAGSTDSRKQGQDPKEKTPSVCLEMSTRSPEDLVGGAGLHLELMFTKQPFVSLGEMCLPLTKCTIS